jgi:hypothetical protein
VETKQPDQPKISEPPKKLQSPFLQQAEATNQQNAKPVPQKLVNPFA